MGSVIGFQQRLFEQATLLVDQGRFADACKLLDQLISQPSLPPHLAAEAHFLLAQARYAQANWAAAKSSAERALRSDKGNPDYHFMLAETLDEDGQSQSALGHFAQAARLAPEDPRKVLRYARAVAEHKNADRGVRLMESVYRQHGDDPEVVANVVAGLVENGRLDDAELVVTQTMYRHGDDPRFRRLRDRLRAYRCELVLRGTPQAERAEETAGVVAYRNLSVHAMGKPGGARRPDRSQGSQPPKESSPAPASLRPVAVDPGMTVLEILRRGGEGMVRSISEGLGLVVKEEGSAQVRDLARFLADIDSLDRVVRDLPDDSRRLLTTLVRAGGYVPASTLFQTTGASAPPPDYVLPLLSCGLVYFGRPTRGKQKLVVTIPEDLLPRLARVLDVEVGK